MATIIDGKLIAKKQEMETKQAISDFVSAGNAAPKLAVILIGDDNASRIYVQKKQKAAERVGIAYTLHEYSAHISEADIISEIHNIQSDKMLSGLIIQLPMPENFYPHVINEIDPAIDVDCLTETNLGKLMVQTNTIAPPTPSAVMAILDALGVSLPGKNITIVGTGILVGKPLAVMCMNREANVTTVNIHTKDIAKKCLGADIIVSAVGKKGIIRGNMVKSGAIVIDAGVDFIDGAMFGDVAFDEVEPIASHITPTPGGVGPMTVSELLYNTFVCAKQKNFHQNNIYNEYAATENKNE